MKIALVCMGTENLGVEYLSAVLEKEGHKIELFFDPSLFDDKYWLYIPFLNKVFNKKIKIFKNIIDSKPDFIAFSVMTDTYQWACSLARELKNLIDTKIIFGGIHPTSIPEEVIKNDFVDYVVVGEGEYALLDIVDGKPNRPNIWFKENGKIIKNNVRPLIKDLDSLPFPNKRIFEKYISMASYMIMTSRDCPFNCTFCCNSILHKLYGMANRKRSITNVIEELILAKAKYKFKNVDFVDDVFTANKKWLREFLGIYKREINVPFRCLTHPFFMSDEVAKLLKESGCEAIDIGIQTLNETIRKNMLNRHETNSDVEKALNSCKKYGLKTHIDHIVGLPGETEQDLIDACKFYIKHKPDRFTYYYLSYFPKTEIIKIANLTEEKISMIEKGVEPMYLVGGAAKNSTTRNFEIMFKLIPITPESITRFILEKKIYKLFRFLPVSLLLDILTLLKTKEYRGLDYIRYYLRNIFNNY
jgi:radical SAM superfamily enzyme YgiQ (UPF0313 family)